MYHISFTRVITLHTNKCWHTHPLLADIITTAGSHFKSGSSQWSEPWLSCDDSGSGRSVQIHSLHIVAILLVPESNLIFSDISWISSISRWIPFQCHWRLVWVNSCCQVLNWVRSESCKKKPKDHKIKCVKNCAYMLHYRTITIYWEVLTDPHIWI